MRPRVVDGDTVVLESIGRVRLIGIDTPETVDPRKPVEYFGVEVSARLRAMLSGERIRLEFDQTRRDRYGRILAYLYLSDGRFVNREMVREGFAGDGLMPEVSPKTLEGLKFNECLPQSLAERVLRQRMSDREGVRRVLAEPVVTIVA